FSNLSASSISLATETPSLVMVGAPKLFSSTTLRPFGPRVAFTALASVLTPRTILERASSPKRISLAAMLKLRDWGLGIGDWEKRNDGFGTGKDCGRLALLRIPDPQ